MTIGANIKKFRKRRMIEKPMNQLDLAKKANVNSVTVNLIEQEKVNTSVKTLMKIADALGMTLDQLVREIRSRKK